MASYNFSSFTPQDFEDFARDIAQYLLDVEVETFSSGRDGGIDFRYGKTLGQVIIQAKHIAEFSNLMTKMKQEASKMEALSPSRYILICSTPLTAPNKKQICGLFKEGLLQEEDIINRSGLENILDNNPDLVKKHTKLWPFTAVMLEAILHSRTLGRSRTKSQQILEKLKYHVPTKNFIEAADILNKRGLLIISGIPGIGKTTLADMLALSYLEIGYEFVYITSVEEGEDLLNPEKKQLFYFDDFLGKSGLKDMREIDDSKLGFFLNRFRADSNSRLIVTTREYILRQGRAAIEALDKRSTGDSTCVIELSHYTRYQKARILYNHLYHSKLSKSEKNSLVQEHRYLKIIDHPNYNPRLIETITQTSTFGSDTRGDFYSRFIAILDNPRELWERAFANSISSSSQYLLYCLLGATDPVELDELRRQYDKVVEYSDSNLRAHIKKDDFDDSLRELDDSFTKIYADKDGNQMVSFANPSVRDYLLNHVEGKPEIIRCIFETALRLHPLLSTFAVRRNMQNDDILLLGRQSGKERILVTKDLQEEVSNILARRFNTFKDVLGAGPETTIKKCSQLVDFWGSKLPRGLLLLVRDFLVNIPVERLFFRHTIEDYLKLAIKIRLKKDHLLRVAEVVLERLRSKDASIFDAEVVAYLNDTIPDILEQVADSTETSIEDNLNSIMDREAEEAYDLSDSDVDDMVENIRYVESSFGLDYSIQRSEIKLAAKEYNIDDVDGDYSPDEDYGGPQNSDSDKAVEDLFNTLE